MADSRNSILAPKTKHYAPDYLLPEPGTKHRITFEEVKEVARDRFTPWAEPRLVELPTNEDWLRFHLVHSRIAHAVMFKSKGELLDMAIEQTETFDVMRDSIMGSSPIFRAMSEMMLAAQSRVWVVKCAAFVKAGGTKS